METQSTKLLVHNFSADVNARGPLDLCGYWV